MSSRGSQQSFRKLFLCGDNEESFSLLFPAIILVSQVTRPHQKFSLYEIAIYVLSHASTILAPISLNFFSLLGHLT